MTRHLSSPHCSPPLTLATSVLQFCASATLLAAAANIQSLVPGSQLAVGSWQFAPLLNAIIHLYQRREAEDSLSTNEKAIQETAGSGQSSSP
ncbi:hypothetical protein Ancab_016408 [Ancistrocladus abbreviatus]